MIRELEPHEIDDEVCAHLHDVIEWLRSQYGIAPVRGELDIKSVILTIHYDDRLTDAAVADAARRFVDSTHLTFEGRSFSCRTDWQSAGVPRPPEPTPRRGLGRLLHRLFPW